MPLNDLQCRNAIPKPKPYKLFDGGGMYLEVTPKGNRYWRLKYRFLGKEKRISLGVYPQVGLAAARAKRDSVKQSLNDYVDPYVFKQEEIRLAKLKAAETFEIIGREWYERHCKDLSKKHAENIKYRLERDVYPKIGRYPIAKLTAPIIYSCMQKVEDRGAGETARRVKQMCSQIFRYAVRKGYAERDVTVDLRGALKKRHKEHFATITPDEVPKLVKALYQNDARLYKQTILSMRLMLLTFVRTSELINARWEEFNLDKGEWHIPAHRMKMRNAHFVPLSKQAIAILRELQEMNGKREHVFPSLAKPGKTMSNATILNGLKRLGYKTGTMTGHGFRALAMTTLKEKRKYPHEVIDRQLAHKPKSSVDQAYDRTTFIPERIEMMQNWADYLDELKHTRE